MTQRLAANAQLHQRPDGTHVLLETITPMAVGGSMCPAAIVLFDSVAARDTWLAKPEYRGRTELQLLVEHILTRFRHLDHSDQLDIRFGLMELMAVLV